MIKYFILIIIISRADSCLYGAWIDFVYYYEAFIIISSNQYED
jgi:hypothetical protein